MYNPYDFEADSIPLNSSAVTFCARRNLCKNHILKVEKGINYYL